MESGGTMWRLTGWADEQPVQGNGSDPLLSLGPLHPLLGPNSPRVGGPLAISRLRPSHSRESMREESQGPRGRTLMVPTRGAWLADAQSAPILGLSWSHGRYLSGAAPGSPQGDRQQQARHVPL